MSQVNFRFPGFARPETDTQSDISVTPENTRCKPIELRILKDGRVYRSKAEQARLNELGEWHHRRVRRRNRFRR